MMEQHAAMRCYSAQTASTKRANLDLADFTSEPKSKKHARKAAIKGARIKRAVGNVFDPPAIAHLLRTLREVESADNPQSIRMQAAAKLLTTSREAVGWTQCAATLCGLTGTLVTRKHKPSGMFIEVKRIGPARAMSERESALLDGLVRSALQGPAHSRKGPGKPHAAVRKLQAKKGGNVSRAAGAAHTAMTFVSAGHIGGDAGEDEGTEVDGVRIIMPAVAIVSSAPSQPPAQPDADAHHTPMRMRDDEGDARMPAGQWTTEEAGVPPRATPMELDCGDAFHGPDPPRAAEGAAASAQAAEQSSVAVEAGQPSQGMLDWVSAAAAAIVKESQHAHAGAALAAGKGQHDAAEPTVSDDARALSGLALQCPAEASSAPQAAASSAQHSRIFSLLSGSEDETQKPPADSTTSSDVDIVGIEAAPTAHQADVPLFKMELPNFRIGRDQQSAFALGPAAQVCILTLQNPYPARQPRNALP
jgi:hypothetical protein